MQLCLALYSTGKYEHYLTTLGVPPLSRKGVLLRRQKIPISWWDLSKNMNHHLVVHSLHLVVHSHLFIHSHHLVVHNHHLVVHSHHLVVHNHHLVFHNQYIQWSKTLTNWRLWYYQRQNPLTQHLRRKDQAQGVGKVLTEELQLFEMTDNKAKAWIRSCLWWQTTQFEMTGNTIWDDRHSLRWQKRQFEMTGNTVWDDRKNSLRWQATHFEMTDNTVWDDRQQSMSKVLSQYKCTCLCGMWESW